MANGQFPLLHSIVEYAASIPMHTANCETDFSQMDLIKSAIKNCLTTENLNKILMINIYQPNCN